MAIKRFKPTSPGKRFMTVSKSGEITKTKPEKSLLAPLKKKSGRNIYGRITARHQGGGHKRRYRVIDFKRDKDGIPAKVVSIEYDPNRSARIALINYQDGEKRYILAPLALRIGQNVVSGENVEIRPGNSLRLRYVPTGTFVHNVEMKPDGGGKLARSAGSGAQVVAKEGNYVHIRMPSGEVRLLHRDCKSTIGQIGNIEHENVTIGKAGRARWLGTRPTVRGSAMNPADHPHGGGEGRAPIGRESPVTPWGKPTLGYKTRRKQKDSDRYILRPRRK